MRDGGKEGGGGGGVGGGGGGDVRSGMMHQRGPGVRIEVSPIF